MANVREGRRRRTAGASNPNARKYRLAANEYRYFGIS